MTSVLNGRHTDWGNIDSIQDSDIDYSELPELDKQFWKEAKLVMPENKTNVTIRLDNDVISWFKSRGKRVSNKNQRCFKVLYTSPILRKNQIANLSAGPLKPEITF
ncbi:MAG: BrnA antitoxin family protein [Proteobacteria bacterium]|nr:BrnA antitoxin family protein [Pseudomonadota bacterium]